MTTLSQAADTTATSALTARSAVRVGAVVAPVALAGNLVALLGGRLAGADMVVVQPGGAAMAVGVLPIAISTVLSVVVGTALLALTARLGARAWTVLAWVGLVVGLLTVPGAFAADASLGTSLTLASMHVIAGVVWFVAVRRGRDAA